MTFKRIVIIGESCNGKTTFAKALSKKLNTKHVELDALFWQEGWKKTELELFRVQVSEVLSSDTWIVDGNYDMVRDLVWPNADIIIWIDLPLYTILKRFFIRSIKRSLKREELWNGCRESFVNNIFSRKSLLFWILRNYKKKRAVYSCCMQDPHYSNINFVHLKSQRAVLEYLK